VSFGARDILGERGISSNFQPLYLAGGVRASVCLTTILLRRLRVRGFGHAVKESGITLRRTGMPTIYDVLLAGTLTMLAIHALKVSDPRLGVPLK
jgi:lactate permease